MRRRTIVVMSAEEDPVLRYEPMALARLGVLITGVEDALRWLYVAEFLEEFSREPAVERLRLLDAEPVSTGDERWDVFLACLAEYLAARDGRCAPDGVGFAPLCRLWFPFTTPAARADALVHAPAAFRRRGVFVSAHELDVA